MDAVPGTTLAFVKKAAILCLLPLLVACSAAPDAAHELVSQDSLFGFLADLTSIQPYSGWRNSATEGEAEALDYVAAKLGDLPYLQEVGLELERQSFLVFNSTELWETRLRLTVGGQEVEVPADSMRGNRDDNALALRFDSDGNLNDSDRNPVVVEGRVVLVRSAADIDSLAGTDLSDTVLFVDYAVVDSILLRSGERADEMAEQILALQPAGLVLVTTFSNQTGESHGAFVGDTSGFTRVPITPQTPVIPTLYTRMEDLAPAGIAGGWDGLAQVEAAHLTWDMDVFSPGASQNLIGRIPGDDNSQAVILGAHIDSPNSPGALDDGSGSAVLLEVARVLDAAQARPPVDLYLAWFGSHEIGLYGSSHFIATHQELLDRTLAMLQIDCLTRPMDGAKAEITLKSWPYTLLGDSRLTWPDYLARLADRQEVETTAIGLQGLASDNSSFSGFDVPNANMIYYNFQDQEAYGSAFIHHAGHLHDPYETVELAREMGDVLEQMTHLALAAALETGRDLPDLRVAPPADRRGLFVASHTESVHMTPTGLTEFGMALSWEGFDVDMIPYGQPVTAAELEDADLVVVLPVHDYLGQTEGPAVYDEAWSWEEIAALEAYVAGGGFLVLTNSAHRLRFTGKLLDFNEDWADLNELANRFGISYGDGPIDSAAAQVHGAHPLVDGVSGLQLTEGNGLPLTMVRGEALAQAGGEAVVALVDHGAAGGQVLALGDLSILGNHGDAPNLTFWRSLARYARER